MIGTVDLVERGYLGIDISHDVIWFSPSLPAAVRSLVVDFCYRGRWMTVTVDHGVFTVVISDGGQGPIQIVLDGKAIELSPGVEHQLRL